jgi:hypothetical protein
MRADSEIYVLCCLVVYFKPDFVSDRYETNDAACGCKTLAVTYGED